MTKPIDVYGIIKGPFLKRYQFLEPNKILWFMNLEPNQKIYAISIQSPTRSMIWAYIDGFGQLPEHPHQKSQK